MQKQQKSGELTLTTISTKILENFTTKEFLRDSVVEFEFITSNKTKDELVWRMVRNNTVLNRFIPFYVKDLYKDGLIWLCNKLKLESDGFTTDYLKKEIIKKWNSDNQDVLHNTLINEYSDKEYLKEFLNEYVFTTTGDKNFLKRSINHNRKWQKKLVKKINDIGLEAKETFTNFVLVKVEKKKGHRIYTWHMYINIFL